MARKSSKPTVTTIALHRNAAGRLVDERGRFVKDPAAAAPTAPRAVQAKAKSKAKAAPKISREEAWARAQQVRQERVAAGVSVCHPDAAPWKQGGLICLKCHDRAVARKRLARTLVVG